METLTQNHWWWPWQDEREEAWLEKMAGEGWHLSRVGLPCTYTFERGEPRPDSYRLDYMYLDQKKWPEYLQIYQDAGWEYLGEMSNWRYWRKRGGASEGAEIFTDYESKITKYRRVMGFMAFFLVLLVFLGSQTLTRSAPEDLGSVVQGIYLVGRVLYAIVIPLYVVIVIKLVQRINQLKKRAI
jgi:hypothetical protein